MAASHAQDVELGAFYEKLAQLHHAGVPLLESLPMVIGQVRDARLKQGLDHVLRAVLRGATLTQAVQRQPQIFSPLHQALIQVGESQGRLDQCLSRLAEMSHDDTTARRELQRALLYPAFLLVASALLPAAATWYTKGFLAYLREVTGSLLQVALPLLGLYALVRLWRGYAPELFDQTLLRAPLLGRMLHNQAFGRFCRSLGALLSGGVELRSGMPLALSSLGNRALMRGCAGAQAGIERGETLGQSLLTAGGFPLELVQRVAVGERAGTLDQTLQRAAQEFDDAAGRARRDLMKALPAVVFLLVAWRVASSVIGFYSGYIDNLDRIDRVLREVDVPISWTSPGPGGSAGGRV